MAGGLPVDFQALSAVTPVLLLIVLAVSKAPIVTGPAPVLMETSSTIAAPTPPDVYDRFSSSKPRFVLTLNTNRNRLPLPRIERTWACDSVYDAVVVPTVPAVDWSSK